MKYLKAGAIPYPTQRSIECACLGHARAIERAWEWLASFPSGGRFKFRRIRFHFAGIGGNKTAKVFTLNTALKGASLSYIFFNKETISTTVENFLVEFTRS